MSYYFKFKYYKKKYYLNIMALFKKIGKDVFIHKTAIIKHHLLTQLKNHIAIDNGVTINTKLKVGNYYTNFHYKHKMYLNLNTFYLNTFYLNTF